ncbi:MAG TPA: LysM peptidoglycan-binding domain-containing protein [Bacteroidales bacterium]|nr:LysM peptidoglycan-binding domain-containing protein [Bacteroidales bacterium]
MKQHHFYFRTGRNTAPKYLVFLTLLFLFTGFMATGNDSIYIVSPGKTLFRISQETGATVSNLKKWNNLTDNIIYPGQRLRLIPPGAPPVKEEQLQPADIDEDVIDYPLKPWVRPLTKEMQIHGLQLAALEQQYDRHLYSVLSHYLNPGSFMVDVKLELAPTKVPEKKTFPPAVSDDDIVLPGLPFVPDYLVRRRLNEVSAWVDLSGFISQMELKKMHILVHLDTIYDSEKTEFVEKLIVAAAKMEKQRNDQLYIFPHPFPAFDPPSVDAIPEIIYPKSPFQERTVALFWFILTISAVVILIALFLLVIFKAG